VTRKPGDYDGDVWDGTLLSNLTEDAKENTLHLGMCSDFCVFRTSTGESVGPVNAMMYNLPPPIRTSFTGLLLMGVIPPKPKSYTTFYNFILERLDRLGCFEDGFIVDDTSMARKKIAIANKVHIYVSAYFSCFVIIIDVLPIFSMFCQYFRCFVSYIFCRYCRCFVKNSDVSPEISIYV
jgi:hypothetical protein